MRLLSQSEAEGVELMVKAAKGGGQNLERDGS